MKEAVEHSQKQLSELNAASQIEVVDARVRLF